MEEKNLWYYVQFEITDTHKLESIYALENELAEQGITFDTGYAFLAQFEDGSKDVRDWQLDWSLTGTTPKKIFEILEAKDIQYELGFDEPPDDWSYRPGHGWVHDEES